ncbi:hypothetical protein [Conchiformibius kuhniae]|uniref:Yip1 domain-containing protein n=1 Tax=Conchiformibius kuhniae TaxID=211502 RepID=A0A8T9MTM2_9NEIS|nr:hypothetical protein [Conchiformibius kuhniae]UOP04611.1 hypothetical protein LVJ77_10300 [Conchiformibius kuhniae]
MNISQLLNDAGQVLRLRYRAAAEYRYPLPVCLAVLVAVGAVQTPGAVPIFGGGDATAAFIILLSVLRCILLAKTMSAVLHYFGSEKLPLFGYCVLTEALILPSVLIFYLPESFAPVFVFWSAWTFWVQCIGFYHLGKQGVFKILLGYLAYLLASLFAGALLLSLFVGMQWFDLAVLQENLKNFGAL